MLAIRLSRVGKKKHPTFRVIVSEKKKDTVGDYLELLGHYNPHTNKAVLKAERIQYWISKGAQPSGTVHNLLVHNNIIEGEKIKVANIKKKKKEEDAGEKTPKATEEKKEEKPAEATKPEDKPVKEAKQEEKPAKESKEDPKKENKPAEKPAEEAKPKEKPAEEPKAEEKPAEEEKK